MVPACVILSLVIKWSGALGPCPCPLGFVLDFVLRKNVLRDDGAFLVLLASVLVVLVGFSLFSNDFGDFVGSLGAVGLPIPLAPVPPFSF
jgi:hypothetical protein